MSAERAGDVAADLQHDRARRSQSPFPHPSPEIAAARRRPRGETFCGPRSGPVNPDGASRHTASQASAKALQQVPHPQRDHPPNAHRDPSRGSCGAPRPLPPHSSEKVSRRCPRPPSRPSTHAPDSPSRPLDGRLPPPSAGGPSVPQTRLPSESLERSRGTSRPAPPALPARSDRPLRRPPSTPSSEPSHTPQRASPASSTEASNGP